MWRSSSGLLLVAIDADQLAFDAIMRAVAKRLETESRRIARGLRMHRVSELRFANAVLTLLGWILAALHPCAAMLENDECVMVFPEGVCGMNEIWRKRDRLRRFGIGLLRIAFRKGRAIFLVAILGADEPHHEGICA